MVTPPYPPQFNFSVQARSPDRILADRAKEDAAIRLDLQELHEAISQQASPPATPVSSDIKVYKFDNTPDEDPLIIRTSGIITLQASSFSD